MIHAKIDLDKTILLKNIDERLLNVDSNLEKLAFDKTIHSFEYWFTWFSLRYCKLEILKNEYLDLKEVLLREAEFTNIEWFLYTKYVSNNSRISNRSTNPIDFEISLLRKEVHQEIFDLLFNTRF